MRTSKSRLGHCRREDSPRTTQLCRRFGHRVAAFLEGSQICPALAARRLPHLKVTSATPWVWKVSHTLNFSSCFACFSSDWAAKNELAPLARIHETLDKGTQNCRLTWRPKRGLSRRPRAAGRSPGQLAAGRASAAVSAARHARARVETSDQGKAAGRNGAATLQYLVRPRLIIRRRRRAPRRRRRRTSGRARPSARATRRRPAGRRTSPPACRRGASSRRS